MAKKKDKDTNEEVEPVVESTESKSDKFRRIGSRRVQNVLDKMRLLGNCSSREYEYTDDQVEKMFLTISEELDRVKALFKGAPDTSQFTL